MTDAQAASTPAPARPPMGIGKLGMGIGTFNFGPPIKKFRWTFQVLDKDGGTVVPETFAKMASRPKLKVEEVEKKEEKPAEPVEETELNFLSSKTWVPGKHQWEPLDITILDCTSETSPELYKWLAEVYQGVKTDKDGVVEEPANDLKKDVVLTLYDGCGVPLEKWQCDGAWPTKILLDDGYGTDSFNLQLTVKYDRMMYKAMIPAGIPPLPSVPPVEAAAKSD